MPQVVWAIIEVAVFVGEHIGPLFAGAYGAFAQTLAFSAAFTGGSYAIRALIPKPSLPNFNNLANQQISVRQSIQPREIVVGKVKKGGTLFLLEMSGSSNEYRHIGLLLSGHQMAGVDETWLDDKQVFFDGAGDATGDFAGFVYQEVHLGDPADTTQPFPRLAAELPSRWGSTDLIRGCGKVHLRIKLDPNKFPSGLPNPKFVIRGALLFDPRSSTTGYSNNAALASRYYATLDRNKGGYGIPTAELDDALVIAAANISDENVALAAGGTEKRYTANGIITTDNDPKQAMLGLLTAMAGDMYCIGGVWRMYAGAWIAPTAPAITASDFRGDMQWNPIASVADSFNAVKGVYVSPQNEYQASDFPPVTNSTYETEDGGRIFKDITLPFTDSPSRAQRIAKIVLEGSRRAGRGSLPLKLTQLNLCAPDVIPVTFSDFGWSSKTLQISRSALGVDQAGRNRYAYGTDLEVKETDANVYAWSTADETTPGASVAANPGDPGVVAPVTSLAVTSDSNTANIGPDGVLRPQLQVTWTSPADQRVLAGGKIQVAYKLHSASDYTSLPDLDGRAAVAYISGVDVGQAYDVQVRALNMAGAPSAWVTVANTTAGGPVSMRSGSSLVIDNANFEASADNPPPGWQSVGATLSYETASPYSGTRSVKINTSAALNGVQQRRAFAVRPDEYFRITGAINSSTGKDASVRLWFFDKNDATTGAIDAHRVGDDTWATVSASGSAPANTVYALVRCLIITAGGGIANFDEIRIVRTATSFEVTPINTSGKMLGGAALSQSGVTTTILIAAKTFQFGDGQVSYSSGSCNPGGYGKYYVYADDPTYSGGAVTYVPTLTESDLYAANGRVYFGWITTSNVGTTAGPTDGGTGSGKSLI